MYETTVNLENKYHLQNTINNLLYTHFMGKFAFTSSGGATHSDSAKAKLKQLFLCVGSHFKIFYKLFTSWSFS